jgi:hypothetical protein
MPSASQQPVNDEIIGLLESAVGVARACELIESWAKAGRAHDLVAVAEALEERCEPSGGPDKREWFESVADHVEDQLALCPGDAAVDALLALSVEVRERSVTVPRPRSLRVRAFASRLGYGQNADVFLSALARSGAADGRTEHQELFACWMHEVVLRGTSLAKDARATRFREALAKAGHPLARMPLELRPNEREAPSYMPLYGDRGLGRAIDTLASGTISVRTVPPPADGAAVRATELDDAGVIERMIAAVRPWAEGKSGKVEAKLFTIALPVEGNALGSWLLRALPLDATAAVARLDCSRVSADGVFGPLFSAASNGGAYSSGLGGAYGRLAAWTSLGALVGAPDGADIDTIDATSARCAFLSFRAPGPWFHDIAWDLGCLTLRADGSSVAVLAASDNE